jgi:hypothetical protein
MTNRKLFVSTLLAAVLVVFTVHFLDFPGSVLDFVKSSGGGVLLDIKPSFSEEEIYQRLADYGEEGRRNYTFRNLTVDVLLPLSVLPFLFLLMLHALNRLALGGIGKMVLLSLPFIYVIFDFAENGLILILLANFPERVHQGANMLPYLTVVKRVASMLAIIIPLLIFGFSLVRRRAQRFNLKH